MLDLAAAHLALRNRLLSLEVCLTDGFSLSCTSAGYVRATGSFVDDGYYPGMEVFAADFTKSANNGHSIVSGVTATVLSVEGGRTLESAGDGKTLTVVLPEHRAWENVDKKPVAGRPYIDEDFVPATHSLITLASEGGVAEETGLYVVKWYGLQGHDVLGIRKCVDAVKALYTPGSYVTDGTNVVRMRERVAVQTSQLLPANGWTLCTISIPWLARTNNALAADPVAIYDGGFVYG